MKNVTIGIGNVNRKGVYAARFFHKNEVVITYKLKPLSDSEFEHLAESQKSFVHTHWKQRYLYSVPERYVNHSLHPNTYQDLEKKCDIALSDIQEGEMITTNASKDDT